MAVEQKSRAMVPFTGELETDSMLSPDASNSDVAWLQRIAKGDRDAFAALYDRYSSPLFSLAFRILNNHAEAEGVLEEVFLQIWEKAAAYHPDAGKPFSWAVAMTRNRSIDRLREKRRGLKWCEEAGSEPAIELADRASLPPPPALPEGAARVRSAVEGLPGDQRQAIEMAFFSGLTHAEIAGVLKEPLGIVQARIRRGMLRLRDSLEGPV